MSDLQIRGTLPVPSPAPAPDEPQPAPGFDEAAGAPLEQAIQAGVNHQQLLQAARASRLLVQLTPDDQGVVLAERDGGLVLPVYTRPDWMASWLQRVDAPQPWRAMQVGGRVILQRLQTEQQPTMLLVNPGAECTAALIPGEGS